MGKILYNNEVVKRWRKSNTIKFIRSIALGILLTSFSPSFSRFGCLSYKRQTE